MCNIILSKDNIDKDFNFIVFNIAFSEKTGKFTKDMILSRLENIGIEIDMKRMKRLNAILEWWLDNGLIFEDINGYLINNLFRKCLASDL